MKLARRHYIGLLTILVFYLVTQLFQQYVLRLGVMSNLPDLHATILASQHALNKARLFGVLFSIVLMIYAYTIICFSFFNQRPVSSVLALIFFLFFCGIEIGYRSIELFFVVGDMGKVYAVSDSATQSEMLTRFSEINRVFAAVYFPLLLSHLFASIFLGYASLSDVASRLMAIAMFLNAFRLLIRLMEFTPFGYLNIFSGPYYFPPVAMIFILLIIWTVNRIKSQVEIS
jgi:hypothetical protein